MNSKPYLTFYKEHSVAPVRQDISDLQRHFARRAGLYYQVGILPGFLKGKRVIEFGPGTGHNAIYTANLQPSNYTLVDANEQSLLSTTRSLANYYSSINIQVVDCEIESYPKERVYDLAICEGVIPGQSDPARFTRHISEFVVDDGVLLLTCQDSIGFIPDILRRIAGTLQIDRNAGLETNLEKLLPFFKPHFDALPNMSRRHDDWIIDNILQHWPGKLFSISDAIETLGEQFTFYGSSPRFFTDWRWYKSLDGDRATNNDLVLKSYFSLAHNFIDHRFVSSPITSGGYRSLLLAADRLFSVYLEMLDRTPSSVADETIQCLKFLEGQDDILAPETILAFKDCLSAYQSYRTTETFGNFGLFHSLWGRGQQYVCFVRK